MVLIESAALSDIGQKRSNNEDVYCLSDSLGLYLVADGMGGHASGEVASRLVAQTIEGHLASAGTADGSADDSLSRGANRLVAAVHKANRAVFEASRQNPRLRGMGSTLAAVLLERGRLIAANVGDSAIYWIHGGRLERLSTPHTLFAEQAAFDPRGSMEINPAFHHLLTRAMGAEATVTPDVVEMPCYARDRVVIASDGLTGKVSEEEILALAGHRKPARACRDLVDLANRRGGEDNITVVILAVRSLKNGGFWQKLLGRMTGQERRGHGTADQPARKGETICRQ